MTDLEWLITDHHISGFTIGRHAVAYRREKLKRLNLSTLHTREIEKPEIL
jgi:hypothetical protein